MKFLFILFLASLQLSLAIGSPEKFFATREVQEMYPAAFATMPPSFQFHLKGGSIFQQERDLLVQAISDNPELLRDLLSFGNLHLEQQVDVLRALFELECQILRITPPELIIDETSIAGYAFFEFDYKVGGPGKVYLNKQKLREDKNKTDFILLLLHETRHSAQFQRTQEEGHGNPVWDGFRASFIAQKKMKDDGVKMSFCDFMLLLNEYEAFQFANYVYGKLIQWKGPINDMGSLAGQYNQEGKLYIDLLDMMLQGFDHIIERFNKLEKVQYEVLYP